LEPDEFNIAAAYGELLLAACVTLIYGSAIPLLYWIAAFGFALRYCVDLTVVLRLYRKPPLYGPALFDAFDETLGAFCTLHVAFGVYFYGA
jgi:hypothetical protein